MSDFKEEISSQIRKMRGQLETFVSEHVAPTVEKATARLKANADATARLDALIAVLVAKGVITEDELRSHNKSAAATGPVMAQEAEAMQPPPQHPG